MRFCIKPREATIRHLTGQQETAGQGRDQVLTPHTLFNPRCVPAPSRYRYRSTCADHTDGRQRRSARGRCRSQPRSFQSEARPVTSLPGGAADKAGNRYEHWWTAARIADVLEGRASRIRLEPPGGAGTGIEFEIDENGQTWGEQAKDAPGRGSWTLNRLIKEGVVGAIKNQLAAGRSFRLVVSTAAADLETLSTRARGTNAVTEFFDALSKPLQAVLENLVSAWETTTPIAWALLKRVVVEHHPNSSLRRLTSSTYRRIVTGDPDLAVAALRSYCDDNLHRDLTGPEIWSHLEKIGFRRRLLAGDTNTLNHLHDTLERQQRRMHSSAPTIGLASRTETARIADRLHSSDCRQVVVVDGPAGYGKSTIISDVASALSDDGWFVAIARMDAVDGAINTSGGLGISMGLAESPTVLLAGVAGGSPALLVVDQLDAVSTYSGRMPDAFDAVAEMLDEVVGTANIKVVLVVRTIDIDGDPRLREIVADSGRVERITIRPLDVVDVEHFLANAGMTVPTSQVTLELLRTPLHLAVFSRLSDAARNLSYRTLQELYEQYTREVRGGIELRVGSLDWQGITGRLVDHMSDHEVLTAPAVILDAASPVETGALESASVLVRDGPRVGFFHESYFDFLFARSFVAGGGDLRAFLSRSGQYLFRRAQTRQVLEHLAATDRPGFRSTVVQLLTSPDIRRHLQDVVVGVLAGLDATPGDWTALDAIAWGDSEIAPKVRVLLARAAWFDAADALGRWEDWLVDPARVDEAFHKLVFAARDRPTRAEELVRPYIGSSEAWRLRLRTLIQWSLSPALADLAVELVERGELDGVRGPVAVNSDFWSIVYGLNEADPAAAARLAGAYLRRGLARAHDDSVTDPFVEHLASDSSGGGGALLAEIAQAAPLAFLDEVLPFVREVALADQHHREGLLPAGTRWGIRYPGADHGVDDAVFGGIDTALRALGLENPDACLKVLDPLLEAESEELRFLVCRALASVQRPDESVEWLLSDLRNLTLGWANSPRWASRELIAACSSTCSEDRYRRLEDALLAYTASWEHGVSVGRSQYELLGGMDPSRLRDPARRRLGELERRFADRAPTEPKAIEAYWVGPPISDEQSQHMRDDDWLRALRKYTEDETNWSAPVPVGGARELAQVLGRRAKEDPQRFANLALKLDTGIPATALDQIIANIADHVDVDTLTAVCEHAHRLHGSAVGRTICRAAQRAGAGNSRIIDLICTYADDLDPDHEAARTEASSGQLYYGGDLYHAGINSTRGEAALAAALVLFASAEHVDRLLPVIDRLATDPILAVRVCAAEGAVALLNHAPKAALEIAQRLFDAPIGVLDARTSERLLVYAIVRAPERFASTLDRALQGPDSLAKRAGLIWAVATIHGVDLPGLPGVVSELPDAARLGAAEGFASNAAGSGDALTVLFDDENPQVQAAAARAMRHIDQLPHDQLDSFIEAFMSSVAFSDNCDHLVDSLKGLTTLLPTTTITACERTLDVVADDLGDVTTARSLVARDLIAIVLRLYRQGDPYLRSRCLDLIDRLTETNAYGLADALDTER